MIYDLIIVGSGSVGSATGYYAAKSRLKVLMIDNGTPPHEKGSHHGATRITRCAYGEGAKYVPLCLRARKMWDEIMDEYKQNLFEPCGVLNAGPKDSKFMKNLQISCDDYSLKAECLSADDISKRWNGIKVPDGFIGVFERDAGYIKSELAVAMFIKISKEVGAEQLFDCVVESVRPVTEGVEVVTDKGTFLSKKAVVSTGSWIKQLFPKIPVTPVRKVFTVNKLPTDCDKMPVTLIMMNNCYFYSIPDADGLKLGKHDGGQAVVTINDLVPFGAFQEDLTETADYLERILHTTEEALRAVVCSYDMSPDEDFIIDTLPESNNILIFSGLSGHGFKFATVFGEIATLFALGEKPSIDITPFSLKRFL